MLNFLVYMQNFDVWCYGQLMNISTDTEYLAGNRILSGHKYLVHRRLFLTLGQKIKLPNKIQIKSFSCLFFSFCSMIFKLTVLFFKEILSIFI